MSKVTKESINRLGLLSALVSLGLFYSLHNLIQPEALRDANYFLLMATVPLMFYLLLIFPSRTQGPSFNETCSRFFLWSLSVIPFLSLCLYFGWTLFGGQPKSLF
jgi:hypothetical protein